MSQKMYFIAINFFWTMWHQNWESLTFLRPTKQISSVPCKKRNFKVLVFKSRRSLWGHAWCHKKCILLTFKGICMNFSLELKKIILSHPMTSKQPPEIVQIHMCHPVYLEFEIGETTWWTTPMLRIPKTITNHPILTWTSTPVPVIGI